MVYIKENINFWRTAVHLYHILRSHHWINIQTLSFSYRKHSPCVLKALIKTFSQPLHQVKNLESLGDRWFTPVVVVWLFVYWNFMIPNKSCQSPSSPTMTIFSIQWLVKLGEGFNNTHALVWFSIAVTSAMTKAVCREKAFFHLTFLGHKPSLRKVGARTQGRSLVQKYREIDTAYWLAPWFMFS